MQGNIWLLAVKTQPAIPDDSKELIFRMMSSIKEDLKELKPESYSGKMVWVRKELKLPKALKTTFFLKKKEYSYTVTIEPSNKLEIQDLLRKENGRKAVLQFLNNRLKNTLKQLKMEELSRGKYFDENETRVKKIGLNVLRGFKFTLCFLQTRLALQIDVCSRVFRSQNLLEEMNRKRFGNHEDIKLAGSTVITNYGKRKTYSILQVDYNKNPKSKFFC